MTIAIRTSDNVVFVSAPEVFMDTRGTYFGGNTYIFINTSNAVIVENVNAPAPFVPGAYTYDSKTGTFAIIDQALLDAENVVLTQQAQNSKITALTASCAAAITAGFTSSAMGPVYTYPSQLTDQQNLAASVLSSLLPSLPTGWTTPQLCMSATGVWAYVNHTAAQIQQVGSDGKTATLAALIHKQTLVGAVMAATTVGAVNAINW